MSMEIKIEQVRFAYEKREILKGINVVFHGSGMYGVFGPNGSGKTTLLKCCAGLLAPGDGRITIQGDSLKKLSCRERGRRLAYVPQEHRLSFPFTVEEVVLMGRTPYLGGLGNPGSEDVEVAYRAMEEIGITDLRAQAYTQLSGGQRQLVLLCRAIAQDTPIIILDEPTSALDFKNQLKVYEILKKMAEKGKMVIACTHDPNHVKWFCEKVLILKEGQVVSYGEVQETLTQSCLEYLYGGICRLKADMIIPNVALT